MYSDRTRRYLDDIVTDGDRIVAFVGNMDADALANDEKTLLAVERLFQRITEAVIQIGDTEMTQIGADLPIGRIRAFGNRLRHEYRNIEPLILLGIAHNELPLLKAAARLALES